MTKTEVLDLLGRTIAKKVPRVRAGVGGALGRAHTDEEDSRLHETVAERAGCRKK